MPIIDARAARPTEDTQIQFGEHSYLTVPHDDLAIFLQTLGNRTELARTPAELRALHRALQLAINHIREKAAELPETPTP